ncbi:hypothetical protein SISNIDRAFT_165270 [Sistotremastrum niveocremeum HHB9708]|uniref:Zn(2)-C6 fungal-type domain-containing protein n=1 Tax=Sistotremastrum niveocremeum HHB9708 TaxID=1314777 RepID=A0A164SIW8_9AGAM|nr:hypothetical protein SISNIDRAFT_165270 [Sistotremastrum niveocremeum HHB9708]
MNSSSSSTSLPLGTPPTPSTSLADPPTKVRQRSSRACDQCRKIRSKCVRSDNSSTCRTCEAKSYQCTTLAPSSKRGPPRGYLQSLESRLEDSEALLGVLVSLPNTETQRILSEMSQDPKAREILARIDNSAFGPSGRKLRTWLLDAVANSGDETCLKRATRLGLANDTADPVATSKTNLWQDHLISLISTSSHRPISRETVSTPGYESASPFDHPSPATWSSPSIIGTTQTPFMSPEYDGNVAFEPNPSSSPHLQQNYGLIGK